MKVKPGATGDKSTANNPKPPPSVKPLILDPQDLSYPQNAGFEKSKTGIQGDTHVAADMVFFFDEALPTFNRVCMNYSSKNISVEDAYAWYDKMHKNWIIQNVLASAINMIWLLLFLLSAVAMVQVSKWNYACFYRSYIPISLDMACPASHMFHVDIEQPVGSTPWYDICVTAPVYGGPERIPCQNLDYMPRSYLDHAGLCYAQTVTYRNKKTYMNPEDVAYVDVVRTYFYHCENPTAPNTEQLTFETNLFPNQVIGTSNQYRVPVKKTNSMNLFANDGNKRTITSKKTNNTEKILNEKNNATWSENKNAKHPQEKANVYLFEFLFTHTTYTMPISNRTGPLKNILGGFQYVVNNGLESSTANTSMAQGSLKNNQSGKSYELVFHTFSFLMLNHTEGSDRVSGIFKTIVTYNGSEKLDNNPKMVEEIFKRSQSFIRNIGRRNLSKTAYSTIINKTTSDNVTLVSTTSSPNRIISSTPHASIEPKESSKKNLASTHKETNKKSETASKMQHIPQKKGLEVQILRSKRTEPIQPRWFAQGGKRLSEFVDVESEEDYDKDLEVDEDDLIEFENTLKYIIEIGQLIKKRLDKNNVTLVSNSSSLKGTNSSTPEARMESKGNSNKNRFNTDKETDVELAKTSGIEKIPLKNELEVQIPRPKVKRAIRSQESAKDEKRTRSTDIESEEDDLKIRVDEDDLEKGKGYFQKVKYILENFIKFGDELRERIKKSTGLRPRPSPMPVPDLFVGLHNSGEGNSTEI